MIVYNIEFKADPYDHVRCRVCGVPWFSWEGFRWPTHSANCPNHIHRALVPPDVKIDKVIAVNAKGKK